MTSVSRSAGNFFFTVHGVSTLMDDKPFIKIHHFGQALVTCVEQSNWVAWVRQSPTCTCSHPPCPLPKSSSYNFSKLITAKRDLFTDSPCTMLSSLPSFDNPLFAAYAFYSGILVLKMLFVTFCTVRARVTYKVSQSSAVHHQLNLITNKLLCPVQFS